MSALEILRLGGLDLNDTTTLSLESVTFTPPTRRAEWVQGADAHGSVLVRDPLYDNRTIQVRVRIESQPTMNQALAQLALLTDKLQACSQVPGGQPLVWQPANSSLPVTFTALLGEITALPVEVTGDNAGWLLTQPSLVVELTLTCAPFWEGIETSTSSLSSAEMIGLEVPNVPGDVPAKGRLVVTGTSSTFAYRYVEWGVQQRTYNPSASLYYQAADFVTTGYAGTLSGGIVNANVFPVPVAVAGLTGEHVGSYRARLNVVAYTSGLMVRLVWSTGNGHESSTPWTPGLDASFNGDHNDLDLGTVTFPTVLEGAQAWTGRVEAYSTIDSIEYDVDQNPVTPSVGLFALRLIPTDDGYGRARSVATFANGRVLAGDRFRGIGGTPNLNGHTAEVGGTWATSGATGDLVIYVDTTGRATTSDTGDRVALLGTTTYTDTDVQVAATVYSNFAFVYSRAIARWVDASNHLRATIDWGGSGFEVVQYVAGTGTRLARKAGITLAAGTPYRARIAVHASGGGLATLTDTTGNVLASVTFQSDDLKTGGALASGKAGFADTNGSATATSRFLTDFYAGIPGPDDDVIHPTRSLEVRTDGVIHQSTDGTTWGPVDDARAAVPFLIPPAGDADLTTLVVVRGDAADLDTAHVDGQDSTFTAQVHYTPRGVVAPR